jgi:hypothetical protein
MKKEYVDLLTNLKLLGEIIIVGSKPSQKSIASVRMQFLKCQSLTKQKVHIAKYIAIIAIKYFIARVWSVVSFRSPFHN